MTDDELKRVFESMRREQGTAHAETRRRFDDATAETRRHFDVTAERLQSQIQLVGEAVVQVTARLDRTDEKIERTAAETQAMIKFSHAELDRRVPALESSVEDLQTRVERLERTQ